MQRKRKRAVKVRVAKSKYYRYVLFSFSSAIPPFHHLHHWVFSTLLHLIPSSFCSSIPLFPSLALLPCISSISFLSRLPSILRLHSSLPLLLSSPSSTLQHFSSPTPPLSSSLSLFFTFTPSIYPPFSLSSSFPLKASFSVLFHVLLLIIPSSTSEIGIEFSTLEDTKLRLS